jgi:hypothetical protein
MIRSHHPFVTQAHIRRSLPRNASRSLSTPVNLAAGDDSSSNPDACVRLSPLMIFYLALAQNPGQ